MVGRLCLAGAMLLLLAADLHSQRTQGHALRRELIRIQSLERADRLDMARAAIDSVLDRFPSDPRTIQTAERIYRRQNDLTAFLAQVSRAVRLDPASALFRQIQLRALAELGKRNELRAAGLRWLAAAPTSAVAYREVALALRRSGDAAAAEQTLQRGLRSADQPASLASELANIYMQQRRWSEAAELWMDIQFASPPLAWDLLSHQLETLGADAPAAAAALLDRFAPLETAQGQQLAALAALYAQRDGAARRHVRVASEGLTDSALEAFLFRFSQIAVARNEPALAAWTYRMILAQLPDDSLRGDLARQVVEHELSAGDTAAADDMLQRVLNSAQEGSGIHAWASAAWVRLNAAAGEPVRAANALQRHIRLYPDDPQMPRLVMDLAEANVRAGQLAEAARVLDLLPPGRARAGLEARVALLEAYVALHAGDYEESRAKFETAAQGLEGPERARAIRLLRFLRLGNAAELQAVAGAHGALLADRRLDAFEILRDGLEHAPVSAARPSLLLWAGELALDADQLSTGQSILRAVFDGYSDSAEAPVALLTLADALVDAGRLDDSVPLFERLIIEYPESAMTPLARRRLAEIRAAVPRL